MGGGPEHILQQIREQSNVDKCTVFVVCPRDDPYYQRFSSLIGTDNMLIIPHRKVSLFSLFGLFLFVIKKNIDIVHSHGKGAGIYGRIVSLMAFRTCVHTFHGLHIAPYNAFHRNVYIILEKVLGKFTKKIICVSEGEFCLIKENRIVDERKMIKIENGVHVPEEIEKLEERPSLRILTVSRFDYQKNPQLLVEIAEEIKASRNQGKLEMAVIGDGEMFESCESLINEKSLNDIISLLGPSNQPRTEMSKSDVFLSTSRWEGMPLAVLEAMSEGLPVVATDVVGNSDVIKHGKNGLLFPSGNAKAGYGALSLMLDPQFRGRCSHLARESVMENYSVLRMVEETMGVYEEVLLRK